MKLLLVLCALLLMTCSEQKTGQPGRTTTAADGVGRTPPADAATPTAAPLPGMGTASFQARTDIGERELGLPLYPGATPLAGGTWRMTDVFSEGAESLTSLRLHTTDVIEKVAVYYRQHLQPGPHQSFEFEGVTGTAISLTGQSSEHASINVVLRPQSVGTRIDINVMGVSPDTKISPRPDAG